MLTNTRKQARVQKRNATRCAGTHARTRRVPASSHFASFFLLLKQSHKPLSNAHSPCSYHMQAISMPPINKTQGRRTSGKILNAYVQHIVDRYIQLIYEILHPSKGAAPVTPVSHKHSIFKSAILFFQGRVSPSSCCNHNKF